MNFLIKFVAKIVLNGVVLYLALAYFPNITINGGIISIAIGALVLAVLNTFLRPILRIVSAPLVWITFGLFNLVINMALLWIADKILNQLTIADLPTLFWVSVVLALVNAFF